MTSHEQIQDLLTALTLEEKAALCSGKDFWRLQGIERLGLPSIMVTDGPHGLRKQPDGADHMGLQRSVLATCFPTASGLSATWNRDLLQEVGVALGEECRAENVSVLLGPGVNMKRHPLGGRNFEYFSEDPYLSGEMASAWVSGVQSQGVGTSLKHFAVNNHEFGRMTVDAIVDERTLREIYLPAFEATVKQSQPWTIMCSYNKLNGTYLAEHPQMLTGILQNEWQFEGMVVTDWGANNNRVAGIKAGQNLEMPSSGTVNTDKIIDAVNSGQLTMAELDTSVARVLGLILKAKVSLEDDHPREALLEQHHELARRTAEQSAVLLKNDQNVLPLALNKKILVIGSLAKETRFQGSGSSQINPYKLEQPLDELKRLAPDADVEFVEGYSLSGDFTYHQRIDAQKAASEADVIVLFAGLTPIYESEGFDRKNLELPIQQRDLINALEADHHKIVLVLQNGAPVIVPNLETIPAVIEGYLGGQAGASALANILLGNVNPSGKLAETFPLSQSDIASDRWFPGSARQSQYREGIWVGYRYFDTANVGTQFPFGHGLSYTEFEYSDLDISGEKVSDHNRVTVTCSIKNVGSMDGAEVVQLYVGQKNPSVPRPKKELKNFEKVFLKVGETKTVSFKVSERDLAFWCTEKSDWNAPTDDYTFYIGASVSDIRLQETLTVTTNEPLNPKNKDLDAYFSPNPEKFTDQAFRQLLGHSIPEPLSVKPFHTNSMVSETQSTLVGQNIKKNMRAEILGMMGDIPEENRLFMEAMIDDMPLRNVSMMSEGKLSEKTLHRLIHLMNKQWIKALKGEPAESK